MEKSIFKYEINEDKTLTVFAFVDDEPRGRVEIPAEIDGMRVARLENRHNAGRMTDVKELVIPAGVVIDRNACSIAGLEKVWIGEGAVIGEQAFEYAQQLREVHLEPGVRFAHDTFLYQPREREEPLFFLDEPQDTMEFVRRPAPADCDAVFFDGRVGSRYDELLRTGQSYRKVEVGTCAFWGCGMLAEVEIPEGPAELPSGSFCQCAVLGRVRLPESLRVVGSVAFGECKSLGTLRIPEGVRAIDTESFLGAGIETLVLPGSLTHVGADAFKGMGQLKRIVVPAGMDGVPGGADYPEGWRDVLRAPHENPESFCAAKTWKEMLGSKARLVTHELPAAELEAAEAAAVGKAQEAGEFRRMDMVLWGVEEFFIENAKRRGYKAAEAKKLRDQLDGYLTEMQRMAAAGVPDTAAILAAVQRTVEYINDFQARLGAVETEERETMCGLIEDAARLAGYPFPEDPGFDITAEWRVW